MLQPMVGQVTTSIQASRRAEAGQRWRMERDLFRSRGVSAQQSLDQHVLVFPVFFACWIQMLQLRVSAGFSALSSMTEEGKQALLTAATFAIGPRRC